MDHEATPSAFFAPPVRLRNPNFYPTTLLTKTTEEHLQNILTFENPEREVYFKTLNLAEYERDFDKNLTVYNLHEKNFQNFCLRIISERKREDISNLAHSKHHREKRLVRAACYAICSRKEIDWQGNFFEEQQEHESSELFKFLTSKLFPEK